MSINSSRYISEIEKLIIQSLLIGNYKINIIFDQEINYKNIIKKISNIVKQYNQNIYMRYWKPAFSKDIGEFPKIIEVA